MKAYSLISLFFFSLVLTVVAKPKKVAFLGVHTEKLAPSTSHQLNLPDGAYLQVVHVGEGSPAEKIGIQKYDILKNFDDQILINPDQLKQLVQMRNPGDLVSLGLLRKGKEKTIQVELDETTLAKTRKRPMGLNPADPFSFFDDERLGNSRIRDLLEQEFGNNFRFRNQPVDPCLPDFLVPPISPIPNPDPNGPVHTPGTQAQSFSYSSTQNQTVVTDEEGTLHWTEKDGQKFLRATGPDGKLIFEGAINTEDERAKLPDGLLPRLEKIEKK